MIHTFTITVRYAETDMMGIVHHSNYAIWAEAARTDLMRAMGYNYSQVENDGIMLPVIDIYIKYKSPTFYEDLITIKVAVTEINSRRVRIDYEMWREDILCTVGYTQHIFMDTITRKSVKIDEQKLAQFQQFYNPEFRTIS